MRKMGIDYGSKRVGIALTDESGKMAFPHDVLTNDANLSENITTIITDKNVSEIVIGHSKKLDGSDNDIQTQIESLITDLTLATGLPIHLIPEQYTTQAALRIQGRNKMTDASAASLILDTYLENNK
ncbi:Holliday junction resolvase RuvX [Candidatus Kaiserbacteria bacterium]|nr:Holliday junction resolvase RuvX [Candidatus Kaiserbacteria bacterium]